MSASIAQSRRPSLQPLAPIQTAAQSNALEAVGTSGRIGRELSAPRMMAPRDTQEGLARLLAPAMAPAEGVGHAAAEKEE